MLEVFTPKRISPDCPFKTVWQIQNVLTRIRIPLPFQADADLDPDPAQDLDPAQDPDPNMFS